jgi:hypothetical protein
MRASGMDPTQTREAQTRRRGSASAQRQAAKSWHDDGSLDRVDFKRDILPRLQSFAVRAMAKAMGSSISHASKVRNGHLVPHKRHWKTLQALRLEKDNLEGTVDVVSNLDRCDFH